MPGETFTASASTAASAGQVWSQLQIPETWEGISGVDSVFDPRHDESGQLVGFKFTSTAAGRQFVGIASPGKREHESFLTWDIATSEIRGWVRVDLHPGQADTRIEVTMRVEALSMMASFGFRFIAAAIRNGFQETADDFARSMEG